MYNAAYSLESNGIAESFVKTFKRDYVQVHNLESAEDLVLQLGKWFEDYNENHSHKKLKMLSRGNSVQYKLSSGCPVFGGNSTTLAVWLLDRRYYETCHDRRLISRPQITVGSE
jgi:hypothetical protein